MCVPCSLPRHCLSKSSGYLLLPESLPPGTFLAEQRAKGAIGVSCSVFIMIDFHPVPCREASGQSLGRINVCERLGKVNNTCPAWAWPAAGAVPGSVRGRGVEVGALAAAVPTCSSLRGHRLVRDMASKTRVVNVAHKAQMKGVFAHT